MSDFLLLLKTYSIRVVLFVASLNSLLAVWGDAPAWLVVAVNVAGVIATYIARRAPQPEIDAKLALSAARRANFR